MTDIEHIKKIIREDQMPYFTDDDVKFYLEKNRGDITATIYDLLIVKSEDTTISVAGLTTTDTSRYFKRLASKYKVFNSGILKSGV